MGTFRLRRLRQTLCLRHLCRITRRILSREHAGKHLVNSVGM
jgi:hypothetical protein